MTKQNTNPDILISFRLSEDAVYKTTIMQSFPMGTIDKPPVDRFLSLMIKESYEFTGVYYQIKLIYPNLEPPLDIVYLGDGDLTEWDEEVNHDEKPPYGAPTRKSRLKDKIEELINDHFSPDEE